ncbi:hypothetical protein M404DRAFT_1000270, partial [Pisolithus tinctorius Marx 270]
MASDADRSVGSGLTRKCSNSTAIQHKVRVWRKLARHHQSLPMPQLSAHFAVTYGLVLPLKDIG